MDLHDMEVVGLTGTLHTRERLTVRVRIKGIRPAYGRIEYLVSPLPLCGDGAAWVNAPRRGGA